MSIYENVQAACKDKGISVAELERQLGFTRSLIYKWDAHEPNVFKVQKVADYLEKPIEYFLN